MELKPIKVSEKNLYPTISESKKSNFIKNIAFLYASELPIKEQPQIYPVAVPSYMPMPIKICNIIGNISIIVTIFSLILLVINKFKLTKCIKDNGDTEKIENLKKDKKNMWWIFGISVGIIIIVYFINFIWKTI